ncbi:MAG TPA: hypothetical protein VGE67_00120, partial [Haloferula sp.]
ASVPDPKVREDLCYLAGKYFTGPGLKEFITSFHPNAECQSAVLTGYCRNLVLSDPSGAVDTFVKMRPSNVNFAGIVTIMNALPPGTDFPAVSATLPDDSKSIAKRSRAALLTSWAAVRPEEAAQYVISNSSLASPDQMGVVIGKWAATSPDDASVWIEALSPGKPRDEGASALARHWMTTDPHKAWELSGKIGDFDKRLETATAVFKAWEKTDREAATRSWTEMFPTTDSTSE